MTGTKAVDGIIEKARIRDAKRRSGFSLAEKNKTDAEALRKRRELSERCQRLNTKMVD